MVKFFGVIAQSKTYLAMFYLLSSFVLGIFYFTFLITGLSLGLGLVFTLLGIPILIGMMFLWRAFAYFEIQQARVILGMKIYSIKVKRSGGFLKRIQAQLNDSFTWKSLAYLFIKFPLGIISFVVLVTFLSISVSLIGIPVLYYLYNAGIIQGNFCILVESAKFCLVGGYLSATLWAILGIFFLFVSLHAFRGLAYISGLLTKEMLKK